ncbi:hypothetical protein D3C84_214690 [compost metagenome]
MGIDSLHEAGCTCLYHRHITFVECQDTCHIEAGVKDSTGDGRKTQTEILGQTRIDAHGRTILVTAGVPGYQLHVHEGGLARFIELLLRVHGVVPIQCLAFVRRIEFLLPGGNRYRAHARVSEPVATGNTQCQRDANQQCSVPFFKDHWPDSP